MSKMRPGHNTGSSMLFFTNTVDYYYRLLWTWNWQPFASAIVKAALSPQLYQDPEGWSAWSRTNDLLHGSLMLSQLSHPCTAVSEGLFKQSHFWLLSVQKLFCIHSILLKLLIYILTLPDTYRLTISQFLTKQKLLPSNIISACFLDMS